MRLQIPTIYPITDVRIAGISIAQQVERLIAGGASFIQLRNKEASSRDLCGSAAEALAIARRSGVRIIINDRVDIALSLNADGVHLGQDDLPCSEARRILGPDAIIGISTHSAEQAAAALDLPVDYVAFGPIFPTSTKENPDAPVGLEGLSHIKRIVGDLPLVAIGGITIANVNGVLAAGADSAAVISSVLSGADQISERMRTLLNDVKHY